MNLFRISFFFCFFFLFLHDAHAATLYIDPTKADLNRGDSITVSVRLDTDEGECVNVVNGVVSYTDNIQPVDISRGSSIFSMWVEEPVINKESRTITFAGGIPNGYCGRIPGDPRLTNNVVDLVFQSPGLQIGTTEGGNEASISFNEQTQVLLNDGFGSIAPLQLFGTSITLAREPGSELKNEWQGVVATDEIPPEGFSIALERTENAFSNDYFITFNTTDKQSGIDHYEVIEEPLSSYNLFLWGAETAPWVEARSPYVLTDQSLNSTIRVKAIDKAGNEYIATLVPPEASRTLQTEALLLYGLIGIGALSLVSGLVYAFYRLLKKRRQHTVSIDNDSIQNKNE